MKTEARAKSKNYNPSFMVSQASLSLSIILAINQFFLLFGTKNHAIETNTRSPHPTPKAAGEPTAPNIARPMNAPKKSAVAAINL